MAGEHKQKMKKNKNQNKRKAQTSDIKKTEGNDPGNTKKQNDISFTLEEVISLGGDQEDFDKLMKLDEDEELIINDKDKSAGINFENLENEIGSFIKELGIKNLDKTKNKAEKQDKGKTKANNESKDLKTENKVKSKDLKNEKKTKDSKENDKNEKTEEHSTSDKEESISLHKQNNAKFDIDDIIANKPLESYTKILLKDCVPWHDKVSKVPKTSSKLAPEKLKDIYQKIEKYWNKEVEIYQTGKENDKSTDAQWLSTVLKTGTLSDKTAALTMLTQESPIHCMRSLDALMALARKKGRREALVALDSLRHLWISDLLPDVKLRKFDQYPVEDLETEEGTKTSKLKLLIIMIYEDKLKSVYTEFLEIIKTLSKDPLGNIRMKILGIVYELLVMKPEQEQTLLSILINKLGDPERTVASKVSYLLLQLVMKHPNMTGIVVQEVERMMFRPNVGLKAQYYACCFLNQIPLSHAMKSTASKLISLYFSFFKILVNKQSKSKETDVQVSKLLSGLLTGVNRAYPYTGGEEADYDEQLNMLFKLSHDKHLSTSIQAFMLIYHVMESRQTVSDRFYQALYEKLLDPTLKTSSKQAMILNLIFRSIRDDPTLKRIKSFVKRLLQVSSQNQASFLCGILFLLSEVIKKKPGVKSMTSQPEDDDEEEHFTDIKIDDDDDESADVNDKNDVTALDSKDEETSENNSKASSWNFRNSNKKENTYNMLARNPLYAGAEYTCAWELVPLTNHFHPSAQHFASSVLKGEDIVYKGDPLEDFTLLRFLDRFMYRNPKKKEKEHGHSLMQKHESSSRLKEQPVNSKTFLQKTESNVREDELFFLRFFKMKESLSSKKKKSTEDSGENEDLGHDFGGDLESFKDMDFASEMKKNKETLKQKKKKKGNDDEDDDEASADDDDSGTDDDDGFDYDDMEEDSEEDFDEEEMIGKKKFSDKDYEEALFSQLNSDGESFDGSDDEEEEEEEEITRGKNKRANPSRSDGPMFASADEFAHILEKASEETGGYTEAVHPKQRKWEEKQRDHGKRWKNKNNMKRKHNNQKSRPPKFAKKKKV